MVTVSNVCHFIFCHQAGVLSKEPEKPGENDEDRMLAAWGSGKKKDKKGRKGGIEDVSAPADIFFNADTKTHY